MSQKVFTIPDKQQKALPLFPPYLWIEGYCGKCGESTFLDDKFPVGWCERCVESEGERVTEKRENMLKYFQKEFPNWRY